jgi:hypothetical protein
MRKQIWQERVGFPNCGAVAYGKLRDGSARGSWENSLISCGHCVCGLIREPWRLEM